MTSEEMAEAVRLARRWLGQGDGGGNAWPNGIPTSTRIECDFDADPEERASTFATALLALHASHVEALRVVDAAGHWRMGVVEMPGGQFIDSDSGSAVPGLRQPSSAALVAAYDTFRHDRATRGGE